MQKTLQLLSALDTQILKYVLSALLMKKSKFLVESYSSQENEVPDPFTIHFLNQEFPQAFFQQFMNDYEAFGNNYQNIKLCKTELLKLSILIDIFSVVCQQNHELELSKKLNKQLNYLKNFHDNITRLLPKANSPTLSDELNMSHWEPFSIFSKHDSSPASTIENNKFCQYYK